MEIVYLGYSSFRLKGKEVAIVTDPYCKSEADIVTISADQPNHNNYNEVLGSPFIIQHPGEYEIKGASIFGFRTPKENICFLFELDNLRIFHLGNLGEKLTDGQLGEVGEVDILMIPIGGTGTLEVREVLEMITQIEPKIVIPMYSQPSDLEEFLKQKGDGTETLPKLTITKLDLPDDLKTFVLERKSG